MLRPPPTPARPPASRRTTVGRAPYLAGLALLCGAGLVAAGCNGNGSGEGNGRDAETLIVYSGRTEALIAPVLAAFEAETGIRVRVNYADTSQLAATLLEEGHRSPADVFIAQDAATLGLLEAEGRLAPLSPEILAEVDPRVRSPRGAWVGTSGRARVLAYHRDRVDPADLPKSLDDLTDPAWRGRIGWAPGNASFQSFLAALVEIEGDAAAEAWLEAVTANAPRVYPSNTPLVLAVASGEVDVALTNHYYLHRLVDEHGAAFPVANLYLKDGGAGSLVNVSAAGVLASSKRQEAAEALVAFLLSETAQAHFARANFEIPLAAGIRPDAALPDLAELDVPDVDLAALAGLERSARLLRRTGALP
jgi:iron(III) transport system substrate-binding protein